MSTVVLIQAFTRWSPGVLRMATFYTKLLYFSYVIALDM